MRSNKVLIVHSARSKIPRRIIVPDDDAELNDITKHLGPGEAGVVVPRHEHVPNSHRRLVARAHGISEDDIPSGRCALVDKNNRVINVIMADPEIDSHPDGQLIASETADLDDIWDGMNFRKP